MKQQIDDISMIVTALIVFGSLEDVLDWFNRPAMALNQQRPIDLIRSPEGFEQVDTLLMQLKYDVYT